MSSLQELLQFVSKAKSKIEKEIEQISTEKVDALESAIKQCDFKQHELSRQEFEISSLKLFKQNKINFNSLITLLIVNLVEQDVGTDYEIFSTHSMAFKETIYPCYESTLQNYHAFFTPQQGSDSLSEIFYPDKELAGQDLDRLLATLILKVNDHSESDINSRFLLGVLPVISSANNHFILPSFAIISAFYQRFDLDLVSPMPTFGRLSERTLAELNLQNKHPIAIFSSLVKNNTIPVHETIEKKVYIFLHDLYHVTAKNVIPKHLWYMLTQKLIPALEKMERENLYLDEAEKDGLKKLIYELNDFNYGAFSKNIAEQKNIQSKKARMELFKDFISRLFFNPERDKLTEIGEKISFAVSYEDGSHATYGRSDAKTLELKLDENPIVTISDKLHTTFADYKAQLRQCEEEAKLAEQEKKIAELNDWLCFFGNLSSEEKIDFLEKNEVFNLDNSCCTIDAQKLQSLDVVKAFIENMPAIINCLERQGIEALDIQLGSAYSSLEYQHIPEVIIKAMRDAQNIHLLTISLPEKNVKPQDFFSRYSIPAAHALIENGVHLTEIHIRTNTQGAIHFAQSIEILAKDAQLKQFSLTPISAKGWKTDEQKKIKEKLDSAIVFTKGKKEEVEQWFDAEDGELEEAETWYDAPESEATMLPCYANFIEQKLSTESSFGKLSQNENPNKKSLVF